MVIDTSALVGILTREPDYRTYLDAIGAEPRRVISAATLYETAVVLYCASGDYTLIDDLREFLTVLDVEVAPFDSASAWAALDAYTRFGKGLHPARLNLLDCVAYQLAVRFGQKLLFKGDDFPRTDVLPAL